MVRRDARPDDASGRTVSIEVSGDTYRLDAETFTQWAVREVAVAVAARVGRPYDSVLSDVVELYDAALDEWTTVAAIR